VRERWFGNTGRRVPEIAVEGDPAVPLEGALVLDDVKDVEGLREAHRNGVPVVVRALNAGAVEAALEHPEVACVLVPADRRELLNLDLRRLKYGG
jgi:hypothetical protein